MNNKQLGIFDYYRTHYKDKDELNIGDVRESVHTAKKPTK